MFIIYVRLSIISMFNVDPDRPFRSVLFTCINTNGRFRQTYIEPEFWLEIESERLTLDLESRIGRFIGT